MTGRWGNVLRGVAGAAGAAWGTMRRSMRSMTGRQGNVPPELRNPTTVIILVYV